MIDEAERDNSSLTQAYHQVCDQLRYAQAELDDLRGSRSWRITKPLRTPTLAPIIRWAGTGRRRADFRRAARVLRDLNDAISETQLNGRYWVWGGLLIGLAREGQPLAHDLNDFDFAVRAEDLGAFAEAVPRLLSAGFRSETKHLTDDGRPAKFVFSRAGIVIDFFFFETSGGEWIYRQARMSDGVAPDAFLLGALPAQPLRSVSFLSREWLHVEDVDLELTTIYGDWRKPRPGWDNFLDNRSLVDEEEWNISWDRVELAWDGSLDLLAERPCH